MGVGRCRLEEYYDRHVLTVENAAEEVMKTWMQGKKAVTAMIGPGCGAWWEGGKMHQDVMMNFTWKSKLSKSSWPGMKLSLRE